MNRDIYIVFATERHDNGFAADDSLGVFGSLEKARRYSETVMLEYDHIRIVTVANSQLKCLLHWWNDKGWSDCNC